ncbi:hypothetical protein [Cryobacterium sp. PAMC25264]|uniref:hypothetical protein n=1 Tax=Cryobacterium sp. PAMC25264 TaxID=2861288 RepID=UPI001C632144|nr:hypothetical protein [Cryobacterium sp. PAMC25264]QYF75222.1 hypothetical protein KY500_09180 [Cryobacterium sp. PAMC25264]
MDLGSDVDRTWRMRRYGGFTVEDGVHDLLRTWRENIAGVVLLVEFARVLERVDVTQSEEESDIAGVAPGSVRSELHNQHRLFGRYFDDDAIRVVDGLPLNGAAESGDGVGLSDLEVQPFRVPSAPIGDPLGGGSDGLI